MLSHFLSLWILFVFSIALTSNSTHCPVSNALNKEDGYLSYPFGIFSNLTSSREEAVVKCSHQLQRRIEQRHCPIRHSSNLCPIHEQNIRDAQSSTTWKVRPTLCSLSQSLMTSNHTVNVFVLGGSFTLGRGTRGCCCDHRLDRKCVPNACSRMREPVDASLSCRWSNFLHLFLASTFKAKVNVINLSSTAQSSDKALFENSDRLKNLTSSDIVFLDYSVNDG